MLSFRNLRVPPANSALRNGSFRILLRKTTFGVSMVKAFLLRNGEERRCRRQFSVGKFLTEQKSWPSKNGLRPPRFLRGAYFAVVCRPARFRLSKNPISMSLTVFCAILYKQWCPLYFPSSSSIIFLIAFLSVKVNFIPRLYIANTSFRFSTSTLSSFLCIVTGCSWIVWTWSKYFSTIPLYFSACELIGIIQYNFGFFLSWIA